MRRFYAIKVSQPGVAQAACATAVGSGSPPYSITLADSHKIRRLIDLQVFAEMGAG
jgi:hypothetical protein